MERKEEKVERKKSPIKGTIMPNTMKMPTGTRMRGPRTAENGVETRRVLPAILVEVMRPRPPDPRVLTREHHRRAATIWRAVATVAIVAIVAVMREVEWEEARVKALPLTRRPRICRVRQT